MNTSKECVARGATWLDQVRPDWFLEVNPRTVTLGLGCMSRCVISQIGGGSFQRGLFLLPVRWGMTQSLSRYGFGTTVDNTPRRLNKAWRKEIKRRRKDRKAEVTYIYEVPPIEAQINEISIQGPDEYEHLSTLDELFAAAQEPVDLSTRPLADA